MNAVRVSEYRLELDVWCVGRACSIVSVYVRDMACVMVVIRYLKMVAVPLLPSSSLPSLTQGLFTGIGKGVMGTFTKPVVGVLDFASSTTAAIRETTSRVSRVRPNPIRLKRNCVGPSGALTPYQPNMARAQTYLRLLTDEKMDER